MEKERKDLIQAQLGAAMENEEFCKAFMEAKDIKAIAQFLNKNNIPITEVEVEEITAEGNAALVKAKENMSDELDEDALEAVSGGAWWRKSLRFLAVAAGGAAIGFACGAVPALTPYGARVAVGYAVAGASWVSQG